jgi:NAD(P)-dependent dehydrogenase (short-subunit alcohol dehydrogenase family)
MTEFHQRVAFVTGGSMGIGFATALKSVGGRFIVDCKEKRSSADSYNEALARKLWELSCEWCGLKGE